MYLYYFDLILTVSLLCALVKFKFRELMTILVTIFMCISCEKSFPDYVQSFERVAVFHNHITYGHLVVTIDFDGYLHHFHVLRKTVLSFEEKHMSVYVKSVFSR